LIGEFGGGGIHFRGRGDHFIANVAEMPGVHAVNMTQPEWNDVEVVFRNTIDNDINLIGLAEEAAQRALRDGRNLRGRVHCGDAG